MQQFAHFFAKTSRKPAELILTDSPRLGGFDTTICVSGKAEARRIARQRNAKCWNF